MKLNFNSNNVQQKLGKVAQTVDNGRRTVAPLLKSWRAGFALY